MSFSEELKKAVTTTPGKEYIFGTIVGCSGLVFGLEHPIRMIIEKKDVQIEQIVVPGLLSIGFGLKIPYLFDKIFARLVLYVYVIAWGSIMCLYLTAYIKQRERQKHQK